MLRGCSLHRIYVTVKMISQRMIDVGGGADGDESIGIGNICSIVRGFSSRWHGTKRRSGGG